MQSTSVDDKLAAAKLRLNELWEARKAAERQIREIRADLCILKRSRETSPVDVSVVESRLAAAEVRANEATELVANQRALVDTLEMRQACERKQQLIADLHKLAPSMIDLQDKLAEVAQEADSLIRGSRENVTYRELFDLGDGYGRETEANLRFQLLNAAMRLVYHTRPEKGKEAKQ